MGVLAAPSLSLLYLLDEVGFPLSTTKVQGHQWYWVYEYSDVQLYHFEAYITSGTPRLLNTDVSLCVNRNLVLRFLITADAVPGRLNQLSTYLERTGVYYGQCSEICGSNHSFMPIKAEVVSLAPRHYL